MKRPLPWCCARRRARLRQQPKRTPQRADAVGGTTGELAPPPVKLTPT
ncbi:MULTISPECIES: hypothetical protein [Jeongeupia]|uniref:Uncharacterized protein n=1 Tax=Jeongeupia naejangsanensis TaxID=613195 RepID=A0ABS2BPB4_9NEIS|nr:MULTISPECIES: hypothetical protein [Jeongeupia]MBM3117474.1 hypothetical protein [Jeongeupia naejangsanensis]